MIDTRPSAFFHTVCYITTEQRSIKLLDVNRDRINKTASSREGGGCSGGGGATPSKHMTKAVTLSGGTDAY